MAQEEEAHVLESEAKAREVGSPVHPRDTNKYKYPPLPPPRAHRPIEERPSRDLRDRLGPRIDGRLQDTRKCNNCGTMGHIARFCIGQAKTPAA